MQNPKFSVGKTVCVPKKPEVPEVTGNSPYLGWNNAMDKFVGKTHKIKQDWFDKRIGMHLYRLVYCGDYMWREDWLTDGPKFQEGDSVCVPKKPEIPKGTLHHPYPGWPDEMDVFVGSNKTYTIDSVSYEATKGVYVYHLAGGDVFNWREEWLCPVNNQAAAPVPAGETKQTKASEALYALSEILQENEKEFQRTKEDLNEAMCALAERLQESAMELKQTKEELEEALGAVDWWRQKQKETLNQLTQLQEKYPNMFVKG